MFITKLGHSCVLVETPDRIALFDPGGWADKNLIDGIQHVDCIVFTHEHPDHFDIDILKELADKFPQAHIICNDSIKEKIESAGLQLMIRDESQCTRKFESPHEELPWPGVEAPEENGYHFQQLFTHPGDSFSFNESMKVLAMPFVSPWGKVGDCLKKTIELKPEYVLPIHDWLYNDESRAWLDAMLEKFLGEHNITVLSSKPGIRHEV